FFDSNVINRLFLFYLSKNIDSFVLFSLKKKCICTCSQYCTWNMSHQNFNVPDIVPSMSCSCPVQKLSKFVNNKITKTKITNLKSRDFNVPMSRTLLKSLDVFQTVPFHPIHGHVPSL